MIPVGTAQQDAAGANEQVWSAEEAYWRYVQSRDWQRYMDLWSDDFVGWPIINDHPIHKTDISLQIQSGWLSRVIGYELQRESVATYGPTVIAFYRVKIRLHNADHSESTSTSRIMHTWMKKDDVWQIVGGMSADDSTL
jgi:ketosteroid isomerase-like protein